MNTQPATIAGISRAEYDARADRAFQQATFDGADAVLVVSRGGGPVERHADVQYLTGYYPVFPAIPDAPGHWCMRGHAAVLIDSERVTLITDDEVTAGDAAADVVRMATDLPSAIADELHGHRLVATVGGGLLSATALATIQAAQADLMPAEDLLAGARRIKSAAELDRVRASVELGCLAMDRAIRTALAGGSPQRAAAAAIEAVTCRGGVVANVFANAYGPDRRPSPRRFPAFADDVDVADGEIFAIDMSGALDGYLFDFSRSVVVGSDRHGAAGLIEAAQSVVEEAVRLLRPGRTVAEAFAAGEAAAARAGHRIDGEFTALGHGLGLGFESPWLTADNREVLEPGMVIAVERMLVDAPFAATFEHDVIVTSGEPEILTAGFFDASAIRSDKSGL